MSILRLIVGLVALGIAATLLFWSGQAHAFLAHTPVGIKDLGIGFIALGLIALVASLVSDRHTLKLARVLFSSIVVALGAILLIMGFAHMNQVVWAFFTYPPRLILCVFFGIGGVLYLFLRSD